MKIIFFTAPRTKDAEDKKERREKNSNNEKKHIKHSCNTRFAYWNDLLCVQC